MCRKFRKQPELPVCRFSFRHPYGLYLLFFLDTLHNTSLQISPPFLIGQKYYKNKYIATSKLRIKPASPRLLAIAFFVEEVFASTFCLVALFLEDVFLLPCRFARVFCFLLFDLLFPDSSTGSHDIFRLCFAVLFCFLVLLLDICHKHSKIYTEVK